MRLWRRTMRLFSTGVAVPWKMISPVSHPTYFAMGRWIAYFLTHWVRMRRIARMSHLARRVLRSRRREGVEVAITLHPPSKIEGRVDAAKEITAIGTRRTTSLWSSRRTKGIKFANTFSPRHPSSSWFGVWSPCWESATSAIGVNMGRMTSTK